MDLDQRAVELLRDSGVAVAYAFGSRTRGGARADSDLDLAVLLHAGVELTLLDRELLAARLAAALDVPDVDLLDLRSAHLELRAHVVRQGRLVLSDDEPARLRFEAEIQSRWFDVAPAHEAQTRAFLERRARSRSG